MAFQFARQLGTFGVGRAGEVLDAQRVVQLAAETFRRHAGAKALSRGVDRGCRTGGTTADHQHFERVLGGQLLGCLGFAGSVDLGEDFGQFELAVVEGLAVEEGRWDRHHVARFDFVLEGSAFDQRGRDARIFKRQQRQRLHHVRTVVAREREIHLEVEIAFEPAHLFEQVRIDLGRVSTGPQQREHERCEFVTHWKACETHPLFRVATAADDEAGLARVTAVEAGADEIVQCGNLFEQLTRLCAFFVIAERGDQFDRFAQIGEIGLQLLGHGCIEHGRTPGVE